MLLALLKIIPLGSFEFVFNAFSYSTDYIHVIVEYVYMMPSYAHTLPEYLHETDWSPE